VNKSSSAANFRTHKTMTRFARKDRAEESTEEGCNFRTEAKRDT